MEVIVEMKRQDGFLVPHAVKLERGDRSSTLTHSYYQSTV